MKYFVLAGVLCCTATLNSYSNTITKHSNDTIITESATTVKVAEPMISENSVDSISLYNKMLLMEDEIKRQQALIDQLIVNQPENDELKRAIFIQDSLRYARMKYSWDFAFSNLSGFDKQLSNFKEDFKGDRENKVIRDLASPTKTNLGKSFMQIVAEEAGNMPIARSDEGDEGIDEEATRTAWGNLVDNLLGANGVLSLVAPPVSAVVENVVTAAGTFMTELNDKRASRRLAFQKTQVEAFYNKILPFIGLYEEMDGIEESYISNVTKLEYEYRVLLEKGAGYKTTLEKSLAEATGFQVGIYGQAMERMFHLPNTDVRYTTVLNKTDVVGINAIVLEFTEMMDELNRLNKEYTKLSIERKKQYIALLERVKNDQKLLEHVSITDIEETINTLKEDIPTENTKIAEAE